MRVIHDSSSLDREKGTCWRSNPTFAAYGAGYPENVDLLNFTVPGGGESDCPCRMEVMLCSTMYSKYYQYRTKQAQKLSVFYIAEGEMYFRSDSRTLLAESGDCVLFKPHCRNAFLHADERKCIYYEFIWVGGMLDDFLRIYNLEQVFCLKWNDEKFFRKLFEKAKNLADVKPVAAIFPELAGIASEILQKISSAVQLQARASYVEEIRDFLESRIKEKVSMTEVAGRFKIDIHDMNRDFLDAFGVTPYQYLKRFRFRKATEMLRAGMLVKEAAAAVGYRNAKTFSTEFRLFCGFSPLDCRKRRSGE